ncbi:MAG: antibiotic biosynthesis monooxygenase [Actinobacteria bacterium]|nr:antibiotic biosynthesis monooxygenase [Actinomycetota bacterium]
MPSASSDPKVQPFVLTRSYAVDPGSAASFRPWLAKVNEQAASAQGFLGMQLDTDFSKGSPLFWSVTYKFSAEADRQAWTSSGKGSADSDVARMLTAPIVETLSRDSDSSEASELILATVPPEALEAYQAQRKEIDTAMARFPGFVRVETYPAPDDGGTSTTVATFATESDLARWRGSPERKEAVAKIRSIASDSDRVLPTGFGQWFKVSSSAMVQTPAWKQAMVVLAVIYLNVSILNMTLGNIVGEGIDLSGNEVVPGLGLPFPVVVFIGNAVGTIVMTWVLMPIVTRLMAWWLTPNTKGATTYWGILLILFVYVIEIVLFVSVFQNFSI